MTLTTDCLKVGSIHAVTGCIRIATMGMACYQATNCMTQACHNLTCPGLHTQQRLYAF